jgi:hypothetical protein
MIAYAGLKVLTHLGPGEVVSVDQQTGMCLVRLDGDEVQIWFHAAVLKPF